MVTPDNNQAIALRQTLGGKILSAAIVLAAALCAGIVGWFNVIDPRTEDAEIVANFIGIAPVIDGPVVKLNVSDNEAVKQGDLLYEIDPAPYQYVYESSLSLQSALEGDIRNEQRHISSQESASLAADATLVANRAGLASSEAEISDAVAKTEEARASLERAKAEAAYALSNLHRLEPLLARHFVTADQLEQARTFADTRARTVAAAEATLASAIAQHEAANARRSAAAAMVHEGGARVDEAKSAVALLEPLLAKRGDRKAAVERAKYDLDHTRVIAPFPARVANLRVSQGVYVHQGQQLFTLIDTRVWWVVANFRETQLRRIHPGMKVEVFAMSDRSHALEGVVESIGYGVLPDANLVGSLSETLPDTQRTLDWVHLASRFPVRIRLINPPDGLIRAGESATVIVHGDGH